MIEFDECGNAYFDGLSLSEDEAMQLQDILDMIELKGA